jgi:phenylalanyl-tRNA synthetase beta chain
LNDVSIDVDLTPNRSDCLSIAGIAREVGVLTGTDLTPVKPAAIALTSKQALKVNVENTEACPRYMGRVIENIDISKDSPVWMQERLRRSGVRAISPVVDVTNYVMLEFGQPMHAFDSDTLTGDIQIRNAAVNEALTLIDGQEVTLSEDTLVIADDNQALAIAGVMGGLNSRVTDSTKSIFLEAAFFSPLSIAGKARLYGLHTDSSHRFERGVDPELVSIAINRATELLLEIVGGDAGPITQYDTDASLPQPQEIILRKHRIKRVLGIDIADCVVMEQLIRLGMNVKKVSEGWHVLAPSFRFDITIEVDLIEELGRLYGYDNLPQTRPQGTVLSTDISEKTLATQRLQSLLVDRGYQEAITYSFVDPSIQQHLISEHEKAIELENPISADLSVMRTSLWPGLIQAMVYNLNRQQDRIRLFEVGRIFEGDQDNISQQRQIGGIVTGARYDEQWSEKQRPVDFFDVKADVEALLDLGKNSEVRFVSESHPALHPGQSARIYQNGVAIGWLGRLHPKLNKPLEIKNSTYLFELSLESLLQARLSEFTKVSRFPAIRRDLALNVEEDIKISEIQDCLDTIESDILQRIQLFDVYYGQGVDAGYKSIAVAFHLQHAERTMTDDEVEALISTIQHRLVEDLAITIRS